MSGVGSGTGQAHDATVVTTTPHDKKHRDLEAEADAAPAATED